MSPSVETTKGTANKLENAKAWGGLPDGGHCPPRVTIVFRMTGGLVLGSGVWPHRDEAMESVC